MNKPTLLAYCDDPNGATGYARQAYNLLMRLAPRFAVCVFGVNHEDENPQHPFSQHDRLPFKVYRTNISGHGDEEGKGLVSELLPKLKPDVFLMIGDVWSLSSWITPLIEAEHLRREFTSVGYVSTEFPLQESDVRFLDALSYPVTHTRYGLGFANGTGYDAQRAAIPSLRYAPDSVDPSVFYPLPESQREPDRRSVGFAGRFVIANVNRNTDRKDLQATLRAFVRVKRECKDAHLYLHCAPRDAWPGGLSSDLRISCKALGLESPRDVSFPANFAPAHGYPSDILNHIYNAADVVVSTSVSEGFGVTPLEALFCERPVLIPRHTGFTGLAETVGLTPYRCYQTLRERVAPHPVYAADEDDLVNRLLAVAEQRDRPAFKLETNRQAMTAVSAYSADAVFERYWKPMAEEWAAPKPKVHAVLWMQESSAGDVLLSTSALPGIRQRHQGLPLHYMTREAYHDIVTEHPLVDEVVRWRPALAHRYDVVYAPHMHRILQGNWGAGNTPLAALYTVLTHTPWQPPTITEQPLSDGALPEEVLAGPYLLVHTSSHLYRNYYRFHEVLDGALVPVIQIGGTTDVPLGESRQEGPHVVTDIRNNHFTYYDLRGRLSYRQTAWLMARAKGFLGIDSFPMHLAGAYNIPMVVTFGSARAAITGAITSGPSRYLEPDFARICPILGPCSGNFQCQDPCGPKHHPKDVRKAVMEVMPWLLPKPLDPEAVVLGILGHKEAVTA